MNQKSNENHINFTNSSRKHYDDVEDLINYSKEVTLLIEIENSLLQSQIVK